VSRRSSSSRCQPALSTLIGLLRAEAAGEPQPGARAVVDGVGQALLGFALRVHAQGANTSAGLLPLMVDSRLGPSVRAVLTAPGHPWTIAELGATVAMSRAAYARHFQVFQVSDDVETMLAMFNRARDPRGSNKEPRDVELEWIPS
jgi:hypothetical protein